MSAGIHIRYGRQADHGGKGEYLCPREEMGHSWNVEPGYCGQGSLHVMQKYFIKMKWVPPKSLKDWCPVCLEELANRLGPLAMEEYRTHVAIEALEEKGP